MRSIQLSSGKFCCGYGLLQKLGQLVLPFGTRVLLISDETVSKKFGREAENSLEAAGIAGRWFLMEGFCSAPNYRAAVKTGAQWKAQAVVGLGGGRVMDTAKIAGDLLRLPVVTVPTSAATCAATALLAVEYTPDGKQIGDYWPVSVPVLTAADWSIILQQCPVRYNIAGMVDAMAKYPEIVFQKQQSEDLQGNLVFCVAASAAAETYQYYLSHGVKAAKSMRDGTPDRMAENAAFTALELTGMISCLAFGGKQAAVAHMIYVYLTNFYPNVLSKWLHGELVGAGLCYQLAVNGAAQEEIQRLQVFLHTLEVPASLSEAGFLFSKQEIGHLLDFLGTRLHLSREARQTLEEKIQYI